MNTRLSSATQSRKTAGQRLIDGLKGIQARRYRSITYTEDGTVIIADSETGKSASGRGLADAERNFRGQTEPKDVRAS